MNLSSTIRRDGTKVHYLHIAQEVESVEAYSAIKSLKAILVRIRASLTTKTNKHGNTWRKKQRR